RRRRPPSLPYTTLFRSRRLMMDALIRAVRAVPGIPPFEAGVTAVNCHHNYVTRERHGGREVFITRKGAVRAGAGDLGIIPGSMRSEEHTSELQSRVDLV